MRYKELKRNTEKCKDRDKEIHRQQTYREKDNLHTQSGI